MKGRGVLLLVFLAAGCRRVPAPGRVTAFVPAVIQQTIPGRTPWQTHIRVTNPGPAAIEVSLHRSPPTAREDPEVLHVPPGYSMTVDTQVPGLPAVSTFLAEGRAAFSLSAVIRARGNVAPPLEVPVLSLPDLARPGDRLELGPFVSDESHRSHFCFSLLGTDQHLAPFEVALDFISPEGHRLGSALQILGGFPTLIEDPWQRYAIPSGATFRLEALFRGRAGLFMPNGGHLWIYGLTTDKTTNTSHFLPVKVVRTRR